VRPKQLGAATVYFLLFTLVAFGLLAFATDFGRLYSIQGDLQAAADAAALSAAARLVGMADATVEAGDQITATFDPTNGNDNRFNLRQNAIGSGGSGLVTTQTVDYFSTVLDALSNTNGGQTGGIDWPTGAYPKYVRVQITAQAPVLFLSLFHRESSSLPTVSAKAVAGVSAPVCTACGIEGLAVVDQSGGADAVNYGFLPGMFYTLYLTPNQRNGPLTQAPLADTQSPSVQYVLLNHIPNGPQDLDLDSTLFEMGAGGISSSPTVTPSGNVVAGTTETAYPSLRGSTSATVGQDILCGLNARFGVEPSLTPNCGTIDSGQFAALSPLFGADRDPGAGTYADAPGLEDFATEYSGSLQRILTVAVIDATDSLNVLNFRQFLIEMSPAGGTLTQGLNTTLMTGAFRSQYIGSPVPLRCGIVGGLCGIRSGVGRTVLH